MMFSSDANQSRMRILIRIVEREVEEAAADAANAGGRAAATRIREAIGEIAQLLELGPEPEVRECPVCTRVIRRAAIRCGYCWSTLKPVAIEAHERAEREALTRWEIDGGRPLTPQPRQG